MKKLIPIFVFVFLALPFVVSAQASAEATICTLMQLAKNIVAAVGFGIAVILLIVSGIRYMTAAGDPEKSGSARKGIINAVIGIVIVVAALFLIALAQGLIYDVGGFNLLGPGHCPQILQP